MIRPDRVKIGHADYKVNWVGLEWSLCNERKAEIDYVKSEITMLETLRPHQMAEAFLHELTHGLIYFFTDTNEPVDSEKCAEYMSKGFTMLWRDNPDAFKWYCSLLH